MIIKEKEPLASYVTFKIGGVTPQMLIPENEAELIAVIRDFQQRGEPYYLLGNGSNILVSDKPLSKKVILNTKACNYINFQENDLVEVGCSVDLRRLIAKLIEYELDSPVALQTIPGTVGGAIFQNASRNSFKVSISDNLLYIRYFDGESISTISKEECQFKWRSSIFKSQRQWVILSAIFHFEKQPKEISKLKRQESIQAAANKSYLKLPSAGSVFKTKSLKILSYLKGIRIGNAEYSRTTTNTIHNLGKAKFKDVKLLIFLARICHWLCRQKIELEIEIWK